ncbi:MAG: TetR/AcrR family transcriptional regulator [Anaerolineaceae bacterium]
MPKGILLTEESISVKRKQIAEAAMNLFLKNGYQNTSMQSIAEMVHAGKSTLYDYFSTKDEILLSILESYIDDLIASAQEIDRQMISPKEKLRLILLNHMQYLITTRSLLGLLTIEVQRMDALRQGKFQIKRKSYQGLISNVIRKGIIEKVFIDDVDPDLTANIALAITSPSVVGGISQDSADKKFESIISIFLRGIT